MIPTIEISDMAWFLVNINKNFDYINSDYCVLHMADLVDIEASDVYINCPVKFMLNQILIEGTIINASNSIIDLVLEVELIKQQPMDMHKFVQQLLQRFPQTLKEIFRMSQTLMEKCKAMENANRINHLLLQVRQLSQDTMEIHEVTQHLLDRLVCANMPTNLQNEWAEQVTNDIADAVER